MNWLQGIAERVADERAVARVVIVDVDGPTPRAVGATMLVTAGKTEGKIGRGAFEREAIATARELIRDALSKGGEASWLRSVLRFDTGPVLGERTGGAVVLVIEVFTAAEVAALIGNGNGVRAGVYLARSLISGAPATLVGQVAALQPWAAALEILQSHADVSLAATGLNGPAPMLVERLQRPRTSMYVYGTGLVARALVRVLVELPFEVTWVDGEPAHFPPQIPAGVRSIATADPAAAGADAPDGGFHAVMTASHDTDLAVCRALLARNTFGFLGVIGSRLKRERLIARLGQVGISQARLARLACPIGLVEIRSKSPPVIAVSIAAQVIIAQQAAFVQQGTKR